MRRSFFAFLLLVSLLLGGCAAPKTENFEEKKPLLTEIKDLALAYAAEHPEQVGSNGRLTLNLIADRGITYWDGKQHLDVDASEAAVERVNALCEMGLTALWVENGGVIFWDDELHGYGILWSETPRRTIREMRAEWYDRLDSRRLAPQWYEIGQL